MAWEPPSREDLEDQGYSEEQIKTVEKATKKAGYDVDYDDSGGSGGGSSGGGSSGGGSGGGTVEDDIKKYLQEEEELSEEEAEVASGIKGGVEDRQKLDERKPPGGSSSGGSGGSGGAESSGGGSATGQPVEETTSTSTTGTEELENLDPAVRDYLINEAPDRAQDEAVKVGEGLYVTESGLVAIEDNKASRITSYTDPDTEITAAERYAAQHPGQENKLREALGKQGFEGGGFRQQPASETEIEQVEAAMREQKTREGEAKLEHRVAEMYPTAERGEDYRIKDTGKELTVKFSQGFKDEKALEARVEATEHAMGVWLPGAKRGEDYVVTDWLGDKGPEVAVTPEGAAKHKTLQETPERLGDFNWTIGGVDLEKRYDAALATAGTKINDVTGTVLHGTDEVTSKINLVVTGKERDPVAEKVLFGGEPTEEQVEEYTEFRDTYAASVPHLALGIVEIPRLGMETAEAGAWLGKDAVPLAGGFGTEENVESLDEKIDIIKDETGARVATAVEYAKDKPSSALGTLGGAAVSIPLSVGVLRGGAAASKAAEGAGMARTATAVRGTTKAIDLGWNAPERAASRVVKRARPIRSREVFSEAVTEVGEPMGLPRYIEEAAHGEGDIPTVQPDLELPDHVVARTFNDPSAGQSAILTEPSEVSVYRRTEPGLLRRLMGGEVEEELVGAHDPRSIGEPVGEGRYAEMEAESVKQHRVQQRHNRLYANPVEPVARRLAEPELDVRYEAEHEYESEFSGEPEGEAWWIRGEADIGADIGVEGRTEPVTSPRIELEYGQEQLPRELQEPLARPEARIDAAAEPAVDTRLEMDVRLDLAQEPGLPPEPRPEPEPRMEPEPEPEPEPEAWRYPGGDEPEQDVDPDYREETWWREWRNPVADPEDLFKPLF